MTKLSNIFWPTVGLLYDTHTHTHTFLSNLIRSAGVCPHTYYIPNTTAYSYMVQSSSSIFHQVHAWVVEAKFMANQKNLFEITAYPPVMVATIYCALPPVSQSFISSQQFDWCVGCGVHRRQSLCDVLIVTIIHNNSIALAFISKCWILATIKWHRLLYFYSNILHFVIIVESIHLKCLIDIKLLRVIFFRTETLAKLSHVRLSW